MSIYVSSSNLVLIPEAALSHWKPYGAGELTGAIISGKDSAEIIKELNQSSILPFTSFFYRKHFVILFDKEQVKNHFEQLLLLYKSQGYIFYSSTLYDDHWSQVLEGTKQLLTVNGQVVPVLELEQNGEFDVVRDEGGLHIVIDDDEDEEKQLEKKVHELLLEEGIYFIGDPGFVENRDMLVKEYFPKGTYEFIYRYGENGWLMKVSIQRKAIKEQLTTLHAALS
ncbi:hypothetical protein CN890_26670 [Priestia megaterium]|uniref:hypothetical protein n=1 Tax=Priestia megaterium TaxID=1404 RepID=UPI000BFDA85E|nr:hypothetical protein [Priestia megaterium]MDR4220159.1 hypothetical protein [Priestia megaterium]PGH66383.1 hypothetical protein CN890_26670 [Priestia megaterium]PGO41941.1 hypothetical protein CN973_01035 [Priestia megaterium]